MASALGWIEWRECGLVHPGFQVIAGLTAVPTAEPTAAIIRDRDHGIQEILDTHFRTWMTWYRQGSVRAIISGHDVTDPCSLVMYGIAQVAEIALVGRGG